jgi:rRNA processing protein Gar1
LSDSESMVGGAKTKISRLGKVLYLSKSGRLILRSKLRVKVGAAILTEDLRNIGNVTDIFGPVINPYVSVRPVVREPSKYVGQLLYVEESTANRVNQVE